MHPTHLCVLILPEKDRKANQLLDLIFWFLSHSTHRTRDARSAVDSAFNSLFALAKYVRR